MVTLEQIKLLESKLTRAINFVSQLSEENSRLKKRNDELEETVVSLKEETTRVEEGIASALGKLNQFEDAIERSLSSVRGGSKPAQKPVVQSPSPKPVVQNVPPKPAVPSAYTVDEDAEEGDSFDPAENETETQDSGEAELDIF